MFSGTVRVAPTFLTRTAAVRKPAGSLSCFEDQDPHSGSFKSLFCLRSSFHLVLRPTQVWVFYLPCLISLGFFNLMTCCWYQENSSLSMSPSLATLSVPCHWLSNLYFSLYKFTLLYSLLLLNSVLCIFTNLPICKKNFFSAAYFICRISDFNHHVSFLLVLFSFFPNLVNSENLILSLYCYALISIGILKTFQNIK